MTAFPGGRAASGAEAPARRLWPHVLKHAGPRALSLMFVASSLAGAQEPAASGIEAGAGGGLRAGTVWLATGVRLHFVEQGNPNGPALILLHGYADSWHSYGRLLPFLPERYHVYAIDQRGHGRSEQPDSGYGMDDLARDVIAFLDARDIREAVLVGHSMGGFVTQRVAGLARERVSALVLIGGATGLAHLPNWNELRPVVLGLTDPVSPGFVREFQVSTVYRPVPDDFMDQAVRESQRLPARVWQALIEGMFALQSAAGDASLPVLLLSGDRDTVFPRSELEALAARYPRARLIRYPEIGHAPHWEDPESVARDIGAFLPLE